MVKVCFKSSDLEHSYRQYYLCQDTLQAKIAIALVSIPVALFVISDYQLFANTQQFYKLVLVRSVMLLFCIVSAIVLSKCKEESILDRVIFFWVLALCTYVLYVDSTRPPEYAFHLALDISLLLAIYAFFPNRFPAQVIPALYFTAGNLFVFFYLKPHSPMSTRAVWVSLAIINLCGIWVSYRSHLDRRAQYALLISEKQLTEELKTASENIKTLSGLLPICASCKNIRDDEGYWHQVEVYLKERTDADFSHGICPGCFQKLYPQYAKKILDKE